MILEHALPEEASEPYGITAGPDGALWFTEMHGGRIALTIYLVAVTLLSLLSWAAVPEYYWEVIPTNAIHIAMIAALWLPPSVRRFFAAHRQARPE
jgi:hypothetical protein